MAIACLPSISSPLAGQAATTSTLILRLLAAGLGQYRSRRPVPPGHRNRASRRKQGCVISGAEPGDA